MKEFLCRKEVTDLTGVKRSTIYSRMDEGRFPRQIKTGKRSVVWRTEEIRRWISDPVGWNFRMEACK